MVGPSFKEGNKWKFTQGGSSFHAAVLDEEFLRNVALHEITFGKGDVLRVMLRTRINLTARGIAPPLREVVKVIDKIPPPKQVEIFDQEE